jgi:hypothetical protein
MEPANPSRDPDSGQWNLFFPVLTNRLNRATLQRFHALSYLFFGAGLLVNVRVSALIVSREKSGSRLAAKIAVDTLLIDVEFARRILGPFVRFVGHNCGEQRVINSPVKRPAPVCNSR